MLHFEIHKSLNDTCKHAWRELEKKSNYNFFQSYDYIKEIIVKSEIKTANIIIIYDNKEAIALLPFEIKKYFGFKVLQWIGTKKSDYCNPIIANNFYRNVDKKNFLKLWNAITKNLDNFNLFFFNNQLSKIEKIENPFIKYFKTTAFSESFQIKLPDTFEDYKKIIREKDKKHFYEIHRTLIKLDNLKKNFEVKFYTDNLTNAELSLKEIIKSKIKQLKIEKKKHNLNIDFIDIYEKLNNLNNHNFIIAKLRVDNKIVSACFGIVYKNIFYYFIPILLTNNYSNFKIGKILLLKLIDWSISRKIKVFDFGLGAEKYKKYFSNSSTILHRYIDFKNFKGFFLFIFLRIIFYFKS